MAHAGGRPLKFKSVEELQDKIDAYFAECDPHWVMEEYWDHPFIEARDELEAQSHGGALKRTRKRDYDAPMELQTRTVLSKQIPYTITGLALALDTTRETLLEYEGEVEGREKSREFADTIKRAKLKVHNFTELRLFENNATGPIFSLKNNYGWKDKTEQDITTGGEPITPTVRIIDERPRNTDTE